MVMSTEPATLAMKATSGYPIKSSSSWPRWESSFAWAKGGRVLFKDTNGFGRVEWLERLATWIASWLRFRLRWLESRSPEGRAATAGANALQPILPYMVQMKAIT